MKKTILIFMAVLCVAVAGNAQKQHHVRIGMDYVLPVNYGTGLQLSTQYEYEILKFLSVGTGLSYGSSLRSSLTMLDFQLGFSPLNTDAHRLMIGLGAGAFCDQMSVANGIVQQLSVAGVGHIMYEYTLPFNMTIGAHVKTYVGSFLSTSILPTLGMSIGYKF